jgi:hypothetical protein
MFKIGDEVRLKIADDSSTWWWDGILTVGHIYNSGKIFAYRDGIDVPDQGGTFSVDELKLVNAAPMVNGYYYAIAEAKAVLAEGTTIDVVLRLLADYVTTMRSVS